MNAKKIAIVTGATGGLGYSFIKELMKEELDEIWALGRNEARLEELKAEFGDKIVTFKKDFSHSREILSMAEVLDGCKPVVKFLINNAGIAQMKPSRTLTDEEVENTVNLNCKAPVLFTNVCLPYAERGTRILNVCSAAAFQPVPYLNLYAATKSFDRSYSRAMNFELKKTGITVTAVCPGWIDTPFLTKVINGKKVAFGGITTPERVAKKAMKDAKRGKDSSVCTLYVKCLHFNVKMLPQKLTMKIWTASVKKYFKEEDL